ncbi:MAG: tetratricopeptide repeat protein [Bacteroidales bacterium]|nr:tetratricopeptide repeat protein [Bacteroidales bacterium]
MRLIVLHTLLKAAVALMIVLMSVVMSGRVCAQEIKDPKIDSLIQMSHTVPDTIAAKINNDICWKLRNLNPEIAIQYGKKGLDFATRTGNRLEEVKAYAYLGVCQRNLDNFDEALKYYKIGIDKATKYGVDEQLGYGYVNLGNLLIYQGKYDEAERQLKAALPIAQKLGDSSVLAYVYLNLGRSRLGMKKFDESEAYFMKAIDIRTECKKLNSQVSVPMKYLADCHATAGLTQLALKEYINTLEVVDRVGDYDLLGELTYNIAKIYYSEKGNNRNYDSAFFYADQSLKFARNIGSKKAIAEAYSIMTDIYKTKKDYKGLTDCYLRQIECYDSLFKKQVEQQQYNIKYSADAYTRQLEIESLSHEKRWRWHINIMSIIILCVAVGVLLIIIFNIRKVKRLNKLIESQNQSLEAANYEITSSINYARRIQKSALSTPENVAEIFPDSMVYYVPKEIVSADWYRVENVKGRIIVAEGDCTGIGVPGSLLTMMAISILKDTVNVSANAGTPIKASQMLDKMRQQVKKMFSNDGSGFDGGMDAAIAVIDPQTRRMSFAAACQTALLIRDGEVIQLKGDSMRVGSFIREDNFTEQEVQLQQGDALFLMDNGIRDLKNPDGERFISGRLTDFLINCKDKPMAEIRDLLHDEIRAWSQSADFDDMTMIGLRI